MWRYQDCADRMSLGFRGALGCAASLAVGAAAIAACPAGHQTEGGESGDSCSATLWNGTEKTTSCNEGSDCQLGEILSCCKILDSQGRVVGVECICVDGGGGSGAGCDPATIVPCDFFPVEDP